jgi:hypothetical protein
VWRIVGEAGAPQGVDLGELIGAVGGDGERHPGEAIAPGAAPKAGLIVLGRS